MAFQTIGGLLVRGQAFGAIRTPEESVKVTSNGKVHTINYVTIWSEWEALAPTWGSTDPAYPNVLYLQDIDAKKFMGKLAKVQLVYSPISYEPGEGVPADDISESGSAVELDIQLHTNFSDNDAFPGKLYDPPSGTDDEKKFIGFAKSSNKAGQTSFFAGTKTVRHTKYFTDKPSGNSLAVRENPPGYSGTNNWLRVGSEVNRSGQFWSRADTYLYSARPWDTDTYD